jgi:hypothetical protein
LGDAAKKTKAAMLAALQKGVRLGATPTLFFPAARR